MLRLCHTTHGTNSNWLIEPVSNEPGINPLSRFQNSIHNSQPALTTSLTSLICGTEYINHATCLHVAFLSRFSCRWFVNQPDLIRCAALRCHDPTLRSLLFISLLHPSLQKHFCELKLGWLEQKMLWHSCYLPVWCSRHLKKVKYILSDIFSSFFPT